MTLLQKRDRQRAIQNEEARADVLNQLRVALHEFLPGQRVMVFGSILKPGRFGPDSDVDLALFEEPRGRSIYFLIAELEERLHRPVDVLLLDQSRFKEKIISEGELWTN